MSTATAHTVDNVFSAKKKWKTKLCFVLISFSLYGGVYIASKTTKTTKLHQHGYEDHKYKKNIPYGVLAITINIGSILLYNN